MGHRVQKQQIATLAHQWLSTGVLGFGDRKPGETQGPGLKPMAWQRQLAAAAYNSV